MSKDLVSSDGYTPGKGQFLVYEAEDGRVKIDVRLEDEKVWLTQQLMAELFQTTKQNISVPIQSIFKEGELTPLADTMSDEKKLAAIQRGFDRLYDPHHPVRNPIETLDSVKVVKTIREALKR